MHESITEGSAAQLDRHLLKKDGPQINRTLRAACLRWPGTPITLRQGARVIEDSRRLRVV